MFEEIISMDNLLKAWQEFLRGKRKRLDVQLFERNLMQNLFALHDCLAARTYKHGSYERFIISDPKTRIIHKATVTDRVLHRAAYRILYPIFDRTFISDSFSCRNGKGTHKALNRLEVFARRASFNDHKTVWVLKCDVKNFFASINHNILLNLLERRIDDTRVIWLLEKTIRSFSSSTVGIGLPLGNLTSQLFSNIYMNELDQFIKHAFREKYYIRYADDFVILSRNKQYLIERLYQINQYIHEQLHLQLHPNKVDLRTIASGVDFLGWVHFSDHRVLRTVTKRRMLEKVGECNVDSYIGLLKHGNTYILKQKISSLRRYENHNRLALTFTILASMFERSNA
ncbi:MAG: reverse transcriptase/maturase family protein [Candidatus Uhrbacteria bacterium]|nr:reverse transcriptase/maturase family protein [Candidatus Uhrbacteria bacterium]